MTLERVADQISDLQRSHVTLAGQVTDLQRSHVTFAGQVGDLQRSHDTLAGQISDLQRSHVTLAGQVTDLQRSHVTLAGQVSDLQTSHDTLTREVRDFKKSTDMRFDELQAQMRVQSASVRRAIAKQSEEDRRYFKMLAEDVRDSVRVVAEGTAHNTTLLSDHEKRLRKLESPKRRIK
ncbi:MAG TPA: hypothetical protein VFZ98_10045 [Vicinamibacterales bacterium]